MKSLAPFALAAATALGWNACMGAAVGSIYAPLTSLAVVLLIAGGFVLGPRLRILLRPTARSVGIGIGSGLALFAMCWVGFQAGVRLVPELFTEVDTLYGIMRQPPGPVLGLPLLLVIVSAEEVVWRGVWMDRFRDQPGLAIVAGSVLYALGQLAVGSPALLAVALVCGLAWALTRHLSQDLLAPLISHVLWDILVFIVFPFDGG